ncbi:gluconokinase [Glaciibacter superstes]|uniref:gluconokinase n=1 Tax=Glaciibacter superstes TaxID=501023 RepID=UPI0003B3D15F|nr:gluconokinase [Glaciibacter superstes]
MAEQSLPPIIVMGVSGSGKTTIGVLLARRLGVRFVDGDDLHSARNKEWMGSGHALSDELRQPWLHAVGAVLEGADGGVVVACSALKRAYRDLLREHAPDLVTVFAQGGQELIHERMLQRDHEYMPASLLQTQFDDLEEPTADEAAITVDIGETPEQIVHRVIESLNR